MSDFSPISKSCGTSIIYVESTIDKAARGVCTRRMTSALLLATATETVRNENERPL
jgi:hypothetical protein